MTRTEKIELVRRAGAFIKENEDWRRDMAVAAENENKWFTPAFVQHALEEITDHYLNRDHLTQWLENYKEADKPCTVGLIPAGNIPLVGLHDVISVFLSGHKAAIKPSSRDSVLLKGVIQLFFDLDPRAKEHFTFVEQLKGLDGIIATGSDNSYRYFEYYFRDIPHLLRKNRVGLAVLDGHEKEEDLRGFVKDVILYFGLGCRNTSQVFIPEDYEPTDLQNYFAEWEHLLDHQKYKHNYDYNYAIYLMNEEPFYALGPTILLESDSPHSRIGCLHFSRYRDKDRLVSSLKDRLGPDGDIQCVSMRTPEESEMLRLGKAQQPGLIDYADGVDTMEFLAGIQINRSKSN